MRRIKSCRASAPPTCKSPVETWVRIAAPLGGGRARSSNLRFEMTALVRNESGAKDSKDEADFTTGCAETARPKQVATTRKSQITDDARHDRRAASRL
jgi:hypothetical protein